MEIGGGQNRWGDEMRDQLEEDAGDLDLMPTPPSRGCGKEHPGDYERRRSVSVSRGGRGGRASRASRLAAVVAQSNRRPLAANVTAAATAATQVKIRTVSSTMVQFKG